MAAQACQHREASVTSMQTVDLPTSLKQLAVLLQQAGPQGYLAMPEHSEWHQMQTPGVPGRPIADSGSIFKESQLSNAPCLSS